jgi:HEAT repeat protein
MPDKRLVEYHVSRLQDKSPVIRLKSIQELSLLGDEGALEILQSSFESDPALDVRKAARDAGRAIFLRHRDQQV